MEYASSGRWIASNPMFSERTYSSEGREDAQREEGSKVDVGWSSGFRCVADLFRPGDAGSAGDLSCGSGRPVEYRLGRGESPPRNATGAPWIDSGGRPQ